MTKTTIIRNKIISNCPNNIWITAIINRSVDESVMPLSRWNEKIFPPPLLGDLGWIRKRYRPISGLPFISKHIEKVAVVSRIEEHLEHNDFHDSYQSDYCRGHSTETVLLKVHSDIVEALDKGSMAALIVLDLSFDVIDHPLLLKRLEFYFGIKETALTSVKVVPRRQYSICFSGR